MGSMTGPFLCLRGLLAPLLGSLLMVAGWSTPGAAHEDVATVSAATGGDAARTQGLRVAKGGRCAGGHVGSGTALCTPRPDTPPAGRPLTITPRALTAHIERPPPAA